MKKHRLLFLLIALGVYLPILVYCRASDSIPDKPRKIHIVSPGETVWGIATAEYPDSLTDEMVYKIDKMNGITDAGQLQIGEELKLP